MNKSGGFTLIEVVITISVLTLLIGLIYTSILSGWKVWGFNQEKVEYQRTQRLISNNVGRYVRRAYFINDNYEGDKLKIKYDSNKEIIFARDNNNRFYLQKDSGNKHILSNMEIANINFDFSDNILILNITLDKGNNENYTFTRKYYPRLPDVGSP